MSHFWRVSHENCVNDHPLRITHYTATIDNFDLVMTVNARSTMLCYKHAAKQMIAQGRGGRIIGTKTYSSP